MQHGIFQGSTRLLYAKRTKNKYVWQHRGWSALTVERASHSARSPVGTISIDASQTGFTCQGFWTSAKLVAPDSDRRTPGITLFYTALGLIPCYLAPVQVWPFDFTRLSFYSVRKWRTWDDDLDDDGDREQPLDKFPSLLPGILSRISGLDPVKPYGRNWSV